MKKLSLGLALVALAAAASNAGAATAVSVNINGYLPAPPGVQVTVIGGRPCYRDHGRVVYLERDERRHKHKRGHAYGHSKRLIEHGEGEHGHGERGGSGHHGKHG